MIVLTIPQVKLAAPLGAEDVCACGSKNHSNICCVSDGRHVFTKHAPLLSGQEKTGYSHPKCYLRPLGDCSKKISREHYIPLSIIRLLSGAEYGAKGVSLSRTMMKGHKNEVFIGYNDLVAKVLCTRHNNSLSALDSTLLNLFSQLASFQGYAINIEGKGLLPIAKPRRLSFLSGYDLERGMAKILGGLLAIRFFGDDITLTPRFSEALSEQILEPMFFAKARGLHVIHRPQRRNASMQGLSVHPVLANIDDQEVLVGFDLCTVPYILRYLVAEFGDNGFQMGDLHESDFHLWRPCLIQNYRMTSATHISWAIMSPDLETANAIVQKRYLVGPIED